MPRIRWSDNDRYFGPLTFARDKHYRPIAMVLGSGGGDGYPGCRLRMSAFGRTLIIALPAIIRPWRQWVDTSRYQWSQGPSKGYWDTGEREYGFTLTEGHLSVALGRVTNDSSTEQRWGCFLPWTQWRHVRHSFYGVNGEHVATIHDRRKRYPLDSGRWERERAIQDAVPTVSFSFKDFDGEEIVATTKIGEREWRFGSGRFWWLGVFRKAKVCRSLDIQFSAETGKRKGSWKGGTVGHSVDMRPGELHEAAFRRYCAEHSMTFVDTAPAGTRPQGGDAARGSMRSTSDAVGEAEAPNPLINQETPHAR